MKQRTSIGVGLLLAASVVVGCGEHSNPVKVGNLPSVVSGTATYGGAPYPNAKIMVLTGPSTEVMGTADANGGFKVTVPQGAEILGVAAFDNAKSGFSSARSADGTYTVAIDDVSAPVGANLAPGLTQELLYFGVYSTDSHGDVKFRYQYTFVRFGCATWLPWLGMSTDPNKWTYWPLSEFPSPWKGMKLLVPTRYQLWHQSVYGYSISRALYLVSTR